MKKINLKGISEILSEKELKNVMGGTGGICDATCSGVCGSYGAYVDGKWVSQNMYCIKGDFGYCGCM